MKERRREVGEEGRKENEITVKCRREGKEQEIKVRS